MKTRTELTAELEQLQEMMNILVDRRLKRFIVRWTLAIPFYSYFWHLVWMRWVFWIAVSLGVFSLASIIFFYTKFKKRIEQVQMQLDTQTLIS